LTEDAAITIQITSKKENMVCTLHIHTAHAALCISTVSHDVRLHACGRGGAAADRARAILHAPQLDAAWGWPGNSTTAMWQCMGSATKATNKQ
jgi:hypothetical protein